MRIALASILSFALVAPPFPVAAVSGFDSAFAGESSFLTLAQGQTGSFTVFFLNTGMASWLKGTATQVELAACLRDQIVCDAREPSLEPFNDAWSRPGRYAVQAQTIVEPGRTGTFSYSVKVPATQAPGTYRFHGDLIVSMTGEKIHSEGYYQDLTVTAGPSPSPSPSPAPSPTPPPAPTATPAPTPSCTPASIATSSFDQVQVGLQHERRATLTCANGAKAANVEVTVVVTGSTTAGNASFVRTAVTDADGVAAISWTRVNPATDAVSVYPTGNLSLLASGTLRWTIASRVLACSPSEAASLSSNSTRTYTVTLRDPVNQGALLASTAVDVTVAQFVSFGTASINGVTAVGRIAGNRIVEVTTDRNGTVTLNASGSGATVAPRVFYDEDGDNVLDANEFRADCGAATFSSASFPVLSCAPTDAASLSSGVLRTFTITARDRTNTAQTIGTTVAIGVTQRVSFGGATINGTSIVGSTADTTVLTVATATDGTATLTLRADSGTITPRAFLDDDADGVMDTGEFSATCGATTYTGVGGY